MKTDCTFIRRGCVLCIVLPYKVYRCYDENPSGVVNDIVLSGEQRQCVLLVVVQVT